MGLHRHNQSYPLPPLPPPKAPTPSHSHSYTHILTFEYDLWRSTAKEKDIILNVKYKNWIWSNQKFKSLNSVHALNLICIPTKVYHWYCALGFKLVTCFTQIKIDVHIWDQFHFSGIFCPADWSRSPWQQQPGRHGTQRGEGEAKGKVTWVPSPSSTPAGIYLHTPSWNTGGDNDYLEANVIVLVEPGIHRRNEYRKSRKNIFSMGNNSTSILFFSIKIKMIDLWMQIQGTILIFIMNFSVLHFFKFASECLGLHRF